MIVRAAWTGPSIVGSAIDVLEVCTGFGSAVIHANTQLAISTSTQEGDPRGRPAVFRRSPFTSYFVVFVSFVVSILPVAERSPDRPASRDRQVSSSTQEGDLRSFGAGWSGDHTATRVPPSTRFGRTLPEVRGGLALSTFPDPDTPRARTVSSLRRRLS